MRLLILATATVAIVFLCGCGSQSGSAPSAILTGVVPWPEDRAASATDDTQDGTDAEQQSSGATPQGTSLLLSATNRAEFAIYRFGQLGNVPTSIDIALDTVGTDSAYVGLADYSKGKWVFTGPYSGPITLPLDYQLHVSPSGNLFVAILAAPGGSAKIDQQTLHGNRQPVGSFTMTPDNGDPPLLVAFDASLSTDPDGNIVSYEWDLDANGSIDDSGTTVGYQFDNPGTYPVTLHLTDEEGATGELTQNVVVHGWSTSPVPGADPSLYIASALVNGNPALITGASTADVRFIRALDPAGASWGPAQVIDSSPSSNAWYPSLTTINGYPAVSYREGLDTVKYIRANDADGVSWAASVVVATGAFIQATSLAEIDGMPAIAYQDNAAGDLLYVRANDAGGATWGTPLIIDDGDNSSGTQIFGYQCSLAVVNGRPAIAHGMYQENLQGSNHSILYVRANDAEGTSWPSSATAVPHPNVSGGYTTLRVVNGRPAIGFWVTDTIDEVGYVRASDVDGTAWPAPVMLGQGRFPSMEVVGGRPAVSFFDTPNTDLRFVSSDDTDGASWPGATLIQDIANSSGGIDLVELGSGQPSIFYVDDSLGSFLRQARLN